MKNFTLSIILMYGALNHYVVLGQTASDAVMMKQRESCLAIIYDYGSFDHYYEGTFLRTNATIATVSRKTFLPMLVVGMHDRLNLIIATPYIKTASSEPNGGQLAGASGFQDINISLKGEIVNKKIWKGQLGVLATVGYSTPMTNYLSDYMPYSLGFGANELSGRTIIQYKFEMGLYARVTAAYLWRGQTQVERDYYYNNGSFYTSWMDVPSAWNYNAVAGVFLLDNKLRIEAGYNGLNSVDGDDIRPYNAPQPTNRVVFGQVGGNVQYYFKDIRISGLGILAAYTRVISGRNAAQIQNFSGGVTYQFKL